MVTVERAAELLASQELVAFPTETVYGLGADATSATALAKLYELKGRPLGHPVIVHLGSPDWLPDWAIVDERARCLARAFWPGPLTLVLKRQPQVLDLVTGGQDTVGLRMPAHPLALELVTLLGRGVAAPSANRFGRISPTTAAHVRSEFGEHLPLLDGGACKVGVESTIVDLSGPQPAVLRPGAISATQLAEKLGFPVSSGKKDVRAPGGLKSHYAPVTPTRLVSPSRWPETVTEMVEQGQRIGALSSQKIGLETVWIEAPSAAEDYAHNLYANLRRLDAAQVDWILIELPPGGEAWEAVRDRLRRAASQGD